VGEGAAGPQYPGVMEPQTWPEGQLPQVMSPPQPSVTGAHAWAPASLGAHAWAVVSGVHAVTGVFVGPQAMPLGGAPQFMG
jgi:hypothetical protein